MIIAAMKRISEHAIDVKQDKPNPLTIFRNHPHQIQRTPVLEGPLHAFCESIDAPVRSINRWATRKKRQKHETDERRGTKKMERGSQIARSETFFERPVTEEEEGGGCMNL